jgi:hypothetical protein
MRDIGSGDSCFQADVGCIGGGENFVDKWYTNLVFNEKL